MGDHGTTPDAAMDTQINTELLVGPSTGIWEGLFNQYPSKRGILPSAVTKYTICQFSLFSTYFKHREALCVCTMHNKCIMSMSQGEKGDPSKQLSIDTVPPFLPSFNDSILLI